MKRSWLIGFTLLPAWVWAAPFQAGPYRVDWRTDPAVVAVGKAKIRLRVTDASGKALNGLRIRVLAKMPTMSMGEQEQSAHPDKTEGEYTAPAAFMMEGGYELSVHIEGALGQGDGMATLNTGDTTSMEPLAAGTGAAPAGSSSNPGLPSWTPWFVGIALFGGAAFAFRKRLSPSVIVSLVLIGACIGGATYAVNHWRRPGSMTPLEAQVMQMDTPAPEGVTPVTLAKVESNRFQAVVRYSGQAAGFAEQDVIARVTGTLIDMPLYAGDRIHKGQVLARLDRSQLTPMTQQQRAALTASTSGIRSSASDYRAAQAMVEEANSEEGQYNAAIQEAEANVEAAQATLEAQKAMAAAADQDIKDFDAQRVSAQAEADYAQQEAERAQKLYGVGAISRSDLQRKESEAKRAAGALVAMKSTVGSMEAKAMAAKAQVKSAEAAVHASKHKLEQAQNEMRVHMAHVTTAKATADSAKQKVDQAVAMSQQAAAGYSAAVANEGYATIVSPIDGIVTQRLVAPGTLIQAGVSILKIAQVAPIRLQANVASTDLAKIQAGAPVRVLVDGKVAAKATVSTVTPAVDATTRTGLVEAILPNREGQFLPGQFVTLEIGIGASKDGLLAPSEAVQSGPNQESYVWVATSTGEAGRYTVKRAKVLASESSGGKVALKGVAPGDWVVTSGFANLADGVTVSNQEAGE